MVSVVGRSCGTVIVPRESHSEGAALGHPIVKPAVWTQRNKGIEVSPG